MVDLIPVHCAEYELKTAQKGDIITAEAPGRMYYMGEHCLAGGSACLVSGIDRSVRIAMSPRRDSALRFFAADPHERKRTTTANVHYKHEDRWANRVKIAFCLFSGLGYTLNGFNVTITTDIPRHCGLAYNIAVEVASAIALRSYFKPSMSDRALITKLIDLHKEFYNNEDKTADFLAVMYARKDTLLFIRPAEMLVKKIKSPFIKHQMALLESKVPWFGIEGELRERQAVLKRALEEMLARRPALDFTEYPTEETSALIASFDEDIRRCCMHIASEVTRVHQTAQALKAADFATLSKIFFYSHESLRDLYEISCPELDWLVKRAQEIPGVLAARMTGKGFGGCAYVILTPEQLEEYSARMDDYERIFGFRPVVYPVRPAQGARLIKI